MIRHLLASFTARLEAATSSGHDGTDGLHAETLRGARTVQCVCPSAPGLLPDHIWPASIHLGAEQARARLLLLTLGLATLVLLNCAPFQVEAGQLGAGLARYIIIV